MLKIGIFSRDLCPFLGTSDIFNQRGVNAREKQIWKISPFFDGDSDEIYLDCCEERRGSGVRQWLCTHAGLRESWFSGAVGTAWRAGLIVSLFTQRYASRH